jgi:hypothetical protein
VIHCQFAQVSRETFQVVYGDRLAMSGGGLQRKELLKQTT